MPIRCLPERLLMTRLILVGGVLAALSGAALIAPAIVDYVDRGFLTRPGIMVVSLGAALLLSGVTAIGFGFRLRSGASMPIPMPAPVRAAVTANVLFLTFVALEFGDGLVRRGGRIGYWTSFLCLPALLVLYGQVSAQRWAWWVARAVTAMFALWFVGFIAVIPFINLRSGSEAVPWYGRVYMAGISLLFASISAYAFVSLGRAEARRYFGSLDNA